MNRYWIFCLLALLPMMAYAETVEITYTEPAGTAFASTCVYYCRQNNTNTCTCKDIGGGPVCTANQNGTTAEAISAFLTIPIRADQTPVCVNYTVTTKDSTGNETAPYAVVPAAGSLVLNP